MRHIKSEKGVIPVLAIISIAIASALFGAGIYAWLSGSANLTVMLFIVGVICGIIVLPNLKKIIRWFKDVKNEI